MVALKAGRGEAALAAERAKGNEVIALDVVDEETLREAGRLIWRNRGRRLFAAGSQGLEYALVAHWRAEGLPDPGAAARPDLPAARVAGGSGRSEEHTAELQSRMRISYALFCLKKKKLKRYHCRF